MKIRFEIFIKEKKTKKKKNPKKERKYIYVSERNRFYRKSPSKKL